MNSRTEFATVPGNEELGKLERDLRFHPSTTESPQALTREQVDHFNREGYLKGIRIFEAAEIGQLRTWFDDLLQQVISAGGNSYSISTAHLKYGPVYDLLTHPRIVALARDLLGENVIGWGSHFFCKMPGDGKQVAWHQDASYWPLNPTKAVTVWLAIDDADRGNGCMKFIPGTHHFGHLTYHLSETDEQNVLNQTVPDIERFGAPVYDELQAGEISLHSDLLLHGSDANGSERRRCGLTLRYCAAEVRAGLDWHQKGVIVSGTDLSSHWANPGRPVFLA